MLHTEGKNKEERAAVSALSSLKDDGWKTTDDDGGLSPIVRRQIGSTNFICKNTHGARNIAHHVASE
jgi:hypothetical protein